MTSSNADDGAQIRALFQRYIEAWNAADFACIANEVYHPPVYVYEAAATSELPTADAIVTLLSGLRAGLDREGFTHSELVEVSHCDLGDGLAFASFHYRRFSSRDPELGKEVLSSAYILRRYPEGWRLAAHVFQSRRSTLACLPPP